MGQRVEEFPKGAGRGSGGGKYPWGEWFDGSIWALKAGEDFDISVKGIRQQFATRASNKGLSLRSSLVDDVLYVQVLSRNGKS